TQAVEVPAGGSGETGQVADLGHIDFPPGHGFVNGAAFFQEEAVAWEMIDLFAIHFVGGANLDIVRDTEHVKQHNGQLIDAPQARGVADGDGVEPPAPARPAGHRAEFAPLLPYTLTQAGGAVIELGGEGAATDPRRVSLDDADDPGQVAGRHARARPDPGRRAVGAGHERIAAMIDVEEASL